MSRDVVYYYNGKRIGTYRNLKKITHAKDTQPTGLEVREDGSYICNMYCSHSKHRKDEVTDGLYNNFEEDSVQYTLKLRLIKDKVIIESYYENSGELDDFVGHKFEYNSRLNCYEALDKNLCDTATNPWNFYFRVKSH